MLSKFYLVNSGAGKKDFDMYYFGGSDDGSMKTGSQSVKDNTGDTYKFYFETKTGANKGAGVTGNQSNKLYYYGMLIQADDYKYQVANIDGVKFIVNSNGSIQHSYDTTYKEDGDELITVDKSVEKGGKAAYNTTGAYKYGFTAGVESKVDDVDMSKFIEGKNGFTK